MNKERVISQKRLPEDVKVHPPQHGKDTYRIDCRLLSTTLYLTEDGLYRLFSYSNYESDFAGQFQIILVDAVDRAKRGDFKKHEIEDPGSSHIVEFRKHRTIKDRFSIKAILMIREGCRIEGKSRLRSIRHSPIKFRFHLSGSNLKRLCLSSKNAADFSWQFYRALAKAIDQIKGGKRDRKTTSIFWMEYYARLLFELFSVLAEMPHDKQPSYFKRLLEKIDKESHKFASRLHQEMGNLDDMEKLDEYAKKFKSRFYKKNDNPYPLALAMYCVEKYQALMHERVDGEIKRKSLTDLKLKSQLKEHLSIGNRKALETFRTTYIKNTFIPPEYKRSSLMKKSPEELESLVILRSADELEELMEKRSAEEPEELMKEKLAEELGDLTIEEKFDYSEHYHYIFSALELL